MSGAVTGVNGTVSVAIDCALRAPVPIDVVPSMKVTVPVGLTGAAPVFGLVCVTVAVSVTSSPAADGFSLEVSATAVDVSVVGGGLFGGVIF